MSYRADTLDCQTCGEKIKDLTPLEAQQIADNPHNFIMDCTPCFKENLKSITDKERSNGKR